MSLTTLHIFGMHASSAGAMSRLTMWLSSPCSHLANAMSGMRQASVMRVVLVSTSPHSLPDRPPTTCTHHGACWMETIAAYTQQICDHGKSACNGNQIY